VLDNSTTIINIICKIEQNVLLHPIDFEAFLPIDWFPFFTCCYGLNTTAVMLRENYFLMMKNLFTLFSRRALNLFYELSRCIVGIFILIAAMQMMEREIHF